MFSVGNRIRDLRRTHNLTQKELAKKVGTSRTVVANWEIGRAQPDVSMLCTLADTFHITVDQLLGRTTSSDDPLKKYKNTKLLLAESNKRYQSITFSSFHQGVLANLLICIGPYVHSKSGRIFPYPFNVYLPSVHKPTDEYESKGRQGQVTLVQPDLTIIQDTGKIKEQGFFGVPSWIVEVISSQTIKEDMQDKLILYEQAGVPEYWIVHPLEQTVLVFQLQSERKYGRHQLYTACESIEVGIYPDLKIDLQTIFN